MQNVKKVNIFHEVVQTIFHTHSNPEKLLLYKSVFPSIKKYIHRVINFKAGFQLKKVIF